MGHTSFDRGLRVSLLDQTAVWMLPEGELILLNRLTEYAHVPI